MWRFRTRGDVYTTPTTLKLKQQERPLVLFVDTANRLYGVNPVDGSQVFVRDLSLLGKARHAPTVGSREGVPQIIVSSDGGNVADFSPDGTALWRVNLDSPILTRALIVNGAGGAKWVVVGTQNGHVAALSLSTGEKAWQFPAERQSNFYEISQPVAANLLPDPNARQIIFGTKSAKPSRLVGGSVVVVDAATGKLVWEHPMSSPVYGSFAIADINLDGTPDVIGETGGVVNIAFALDGRTGAPLFDETNQKFLEKPRAVTSVIVQPNLLQAFSTVPSEASPTPLIQDVNDDGLLELVFLDHDFTGVTLYRTVTPASSVMASNAVPSATGVAASTK